MALRVAVCGGGIGGLTAAHSILLLGDKDVQVDVSEASTYQVCGSFSGQVDFRRKGLACRSVPMP